MLDFEFDGSLDFGEEEEKPVDLQKDPKKRVAVQHRYGNRHICLIESSANVNTNPRSENTVLTVDRSLVADYVELFNGIQSFDTTRKDAEPYQIPEDRTMKRGGKR